MEIYVEEEEEEETSASRAGGPRPMLIRARESSFRKSS